MTPVMRQRTWLAILGAAAIGACLYVALSAPLGSDYPGPTCSGCDYAGPPIEALIRGHLATFFATEPFMGSVTLLLRAPIVAMVRLLGGSELWQYRLGALACLLVAAALMWTVARQMARRGQSSLSQLVVVGLALIGPMAFKALQWGHPEEFVGASLAVGAVLLAAHRRWTLAGVALGLALATKQWGVFAVLPVLMLAGHERRRVAAVAAGTAALLILPMLAGNPARFITQNFNAGVAGAGVTQTNLWWPFHVQTGIDATTGAGIYSVPAWMGSIAHPLVLVLGVSLSVVYWRRRRGAHPYEAVQLLALLFLLRCLLDPLTISYHHLPFVIALAVYEGLRRRGLPIVSMWSAVALWFIAQVVAPSGNLDELNLAYLAWGLPTAGYLTLLCFAPQTALSFRGPRLEQPPLPA